jgi:predicted Zn-dependent protease
VNGLAAKTYPHTESGVKVDIPNDWNVSGDDHALEASTKDDLAHLYFIVMPAGSMEAALDSLDAELGKVVQDLSHGEPELMKLNGMDAVTVEGKGKVEGHAVEIGVMVVKTPSGKVLLVFGLVAQQGTAKHQRALGGILKSIKRI